MDRSRKFSVTVGRAAELLLAVVFLAGAVLKALDVDRFVVQISYYHVIERQSLLTVAALSTLWVETALGVALLLRLRLRGLTFAAVLGLLAVFTGLIAYSWAFYDLKDCGCFGPIEMSPRVSIAKNVFLLLCCGAAWWGFHHRDTENTEKGVRFVAAVVKMLACVAVAAAVDVYAYSNMEIINDTPRPFAQFAFETDGVQWDLGHGEYFVPMLSMTCEHCMASVNAINDLALESDFPPIVALCYEENKGDLDAFRETTGAVFPLYSLGDRVRTFYEMAPVPPRFYLIRDGAALQHWDEKPPEPAIVRGLLAQHRPLGITN